MPHRRAAFAVFIAIFLFALPAAAAEKLVGGDVPPDFVGVDAEGRDVRISDSRGKVVALVFCGCAAVSQHALHAPAALGRGRSRRHRP